MHVIETTFAELFENISQDEQYVFEPDIEYFQKKEIEIQDENGNWRPIVGLITKTDFLRILEWSDGSITKCADKHWIRTEGINCKLASDFAIGDEILRSDGITLICMKNTLTNQIETFYDMQIDTPSHLYQTADGIVHHNTLLAQSIAKMLDVPISIADTTSLTEAGYVGDDVESIITRLLQAADGNIKKAERGIIFLDEIDKKRSREGSGTSSRDVAGEGVQQALLKLLEGTEVMVPYGNRKGPNSDLVKVNTRNILFILSGAFVGLDKMLENEKETGIGFGANVEKQKTKVSDMLKRIEPDHLIRFGLIPELIGRVPVITLLEELDEEQLIRVLTEPKNALIKQYSKMFSLDGIDLLFKPEALQAVAKIARTRKTNGRALRGVLETRLLRTQFDLPDLRDKGVGQIIIDAATILDGTEPELVYKGS